MCIVQACVRFRSLIPGVARAAMLAAVLLSLLLQSTRSGFAAEADNVPLFEGLGEHGRVVTTTSAAAQRYFDQGLCFLYAFNHDEAIRSFRQAAHLDPQCAMAWWGIALAHGPNINNPLMSAQQSQAAWQALTRARDAGGGSAIERELIDALSKRYIEPTAGMEIPPEARIPLDQAYAEAMRAVWQAHPEDADVGALFAESMMDLRPWDLWTPDGQAQPGTLEVIATLEAALTQSPHHPLALHLYIHALEASPQPQKAIAPADRLRKLQPGLGHMVHMPSHIDVRTGQWLKAIESNALAIEADRRYRAQSPQQDFYQIYMAHNYHMLAYAAMMRGQSELAIATIQEMTKTMPAEWVAKNPAFADGFMAMPLEVLVRFGRWDEILAAPEPAEALVYTRAMRHCARGIAFAAKGDVQHARQEERTFATAAALVPAEARVGNNVAADVLKVAEHLLKGEIQVRCGDTATGIASLREAARHEDLLRYSEPPDWIHPVRHALGATLMADGQHVEAEAVYRQDLAKLPNNGWSLLGMARSLKAQGKLEEAGKYDAQFETVWCDADIKISSSCLCQPGR